MGRKIFSTNITKGKKIIVGVTLLAVAFSCYATNLNPLMEVMNVGFGRVVEQATHASQDNIGKLTSIERLHDHALAQVTKTANLSQTIGEALGSPLQLPNADRIKELTLRWMQDLITDPSRLLGSANALEINTPIPKFGGRLPLDLNIDFSNTYDQVASKLIAKDATAPEAKRLAALREFMVEEATINGVALATTNKQTVNKVRARVKDIADDAADSKSLRGDVHITNDYLMLIAMEMSQIRELQAQQLELLAAFTRTFTEPQAHLKAKQEFRRIGAK